ncbi:MAG: hypothetical protein V3T17_03420 [Pseudomonadales bacterium]
MSLNKNLAGLVVASSCAAFLSACGGGGSSDIWPTETGTSTGSNVGTFVDSAVKNIAFSTETLTGRTDEFGNFLYLDNENVTFSIGNIKFPTIAAKGTVTPQDMVDSGDLNDPVVINILRLLQSLDDDGIPGNGITILDGAHTQAETLVVDFSSDTFATDPDVEMLVKGSGSVSTVLVSEEKAIQHFSNVIRFEILQASITIGTKTTTNTAVTLTATVGEIDGLDATSLDFEWTVTHDGSKETLQNAPVVSFTPLGAGDYSVALKVIHQNNDYFDGVAEAVVVTVKDPIVDNTAPTAVIANTATDVMLSAGVTLDGTGSSDVQTTDPTALVYTWVCTFTPTAGLPSPVAITGEKTATATIAPFVLVEEGVLACDLTVADGELDNKATYMANIVKTLPSASSMLGSALVGLYLLSIWVRRRKQR